MARFDGVRSSGAGPGVVMVDGQPLDPRKSQLIRNHSPDGFNWGYAGSGPAQLALALLLEAFSDHPQASLLVAERQYQEFKRDVVSQMPLNWSLTTDEILGWADGRLTRDYFTAKWKMPHE